MMNPERTGPGRRLGRYELLRLIGEGGMAQVWAARMEGPRGFRKIVALKMLIPVLANDPQFQRMFLDEANLSAKVHHRNVVEIYELGEDAGVLFLVMELIDGQSLQRMLRPSKQVRPLPPEIAARIVADAASGLHAAHELSDERGNPLGIVHRDVCPQNILVDRDGTVKVADFGIVKAIERVGETTQTGEIKGKCEYMSPEQARSQPVDRRSDVFSLGIVLFETVTGVKPFHGAHDIIVMQQIASTDPPRPTSLAPACPPELEWIILTALSRDPAKRFQTAAAMATALEQYVARADPAMVGRVADELRVRCGEKMDELRQRIRASAATREPDQSALDPGELHAGSLNTPPSSGSAARRPRVGTPSAGTLALPTPHIGLEPSAAKASKLPWLVAAVSTGVAVAALAFLLLRPAPRRADETPSVSPVTAAEGAAAQAGLVPQGQPIALHVEPKMAVVRLEGAVIGVGDQLIARPPHGGSLSIEARADGYLPKAVTITPDSPDELALSLDAETAALAPTTPPPEPEAGAEPAPTASAKAHKGGRPGRGAGGTTPPTVPANPY